MQVELLYSVVVLSQRQGRLGSIWKPRNHQQASVCCMRICSSSRKHSGVCQQKILNNIKREVSLHIYTSLMDVCVYVHGLYKEVCLFQGLMHQLFQSWVYWVWRHTSEAVRTFRLVVSCLALYVRQHSQPSVCIVVRKGKCETVSLYRCRS